MKLLTISAVEQGINRSISECPVVNNALPKGARLLSDVYGLMIYEKLMEINLDEYLEKNVFQNIHLEAVNQFCNVA